MITPEKIVDFQKKILSWYAIHKRLWLPWRDSFDQYKVLVSEVMLQQTQVDRVVPKFEAFMEQAPTMEALAVLDRTTLLTLRSGLWFNSRALRLQQCAKIIVEEHWGILPKDRETLRSLPWIGAYSSASLLAFVYNMSAPVIDTNIRRVLIAELWVPEDTPQRGLEAIAFAVTPEGQANDRNNALMDYGSLVATVSATWIKPKSKQSKFAWSTRQVRGNIVKHLVTHWPTSIAILQQTFPHDKFSAIVDRMVRDGIVVSDGWVLRLE